MNKKKLKQAIKGDKFIDIAELLGIKRVAMSRRLNGHVDFSISEIRIIAEHYDLDEKQINEIFFAR